MKKLLFITMCICTLHSLRAQNLYTTTITGGTNNSGTISKLEVSTNTLSATFNFDEGNDGSRPAQLKLVQATDGKLYGMTPNGGINYSGVIFSYSPITNTYSKLYDFDEYGSLDGGYPSGSLVQANDGRLYGMANSGGSNNSGVIFSFDPSTNMYRKLYDFDDFNGGHPRGSLVQASDGKLYAMTPNGGSSYGGVIFSFDPSTTTYNKLHDFDFNNGAYPNGNLLQANDGNLYGMTPNGGSNNFGVVFSFDPTTTTFNNLQDLDGTNGTNPKGSLIQATNGKLYGTTVYTSNGQGDGTLFSYDIGSDAYNRVRAFGANEHGNVAYNTLLKAGTGKLYGITAFGGTDGMGVIYSYDPATDSYNKLYDFKGNDGNTSTSSLIEATDGKLYGMTLQGGSSGAGVIFAFDPITNTYSKLHDFDLYNDGGYPYGGLVQATDGKLYGLTSSGGSNYGGVIFSFDPLTNTHSNLYNFDGTNGRQSYSTLLQATDGKMYGMTISGGSNDVGVIFSFNPSGAIYNKLYDFDGTNEGISLGSLVQATDGKLYGMSSYINVQGTGNLFSYDPATASYNSLYDFTGPDGATPFGSLIQASDGKLYGATTYGGNIDGGVAFNYDLSNATYTKLADFDGTNGANPGLGAFTETACAAPATYYRDADNDGFGDAGNATTVCSNTPPDGYVSDSTDCDDADASVYPGARELPDGKDNDCDGTVDDNAITPKITINDKAVSEGNFGYKTATFIVKLSKKPLQTITVEYRTEDLSATAPSDYTAVSGTLTFQPGVVKQTLQVSIKGDRQVEADETYKVILSNPTNATIKDGTGIGTILNNDGTTTTLSRSVTAAISSSSTPTLKVSPNPAGSIAMAQLSGFSGAVSLTLTNQQGKVVQQYQLQSGNVKMLQQQLNVTAIASGTYFIIARDEKGSQQTAQIVIAH